MSELKEETKGEVEEVTILSLPFDIREHIFSFLHLDERLRQGRVCFSFYEITSMPREINLGDSTGEESNTRSPKARYRLLLERDGSRTAVVEGIIERSGKVQVLRGWGKLPWPAGIWSSMPMLKSLELEKASKEVLDGALQSCPLIEELTLNCMKEPVDVASLFSSLPRLSSLSFDTCELKVSDQCPASPRLKKLVLEDNIYSPKLQDATVLSLLALCLTLTHLALKWCYKLADASLGQIGKCLPLLSSLTLSSVHPSAECLTALMSSLPPTMQEATLNGCGCKDQHVMALCRCPALKKLHIFSEVLTDESMAAALAVLPEGHFTDLALTYTTLSGSFFITHARLFTHLKKLDLRSSYELEDASMEALFPCCFLLEWVNLRDCSELTNCTFAALGAHCPRLREVNFSETQITDAGLSAVIHGCPMLKSLRVRACGKLTHRSLALISETLPQLRILGFDQGWSPGEGATVEDYAEALLQVAARCPLLTEVWVPSFKEHGSRVAEAFATHCKYLLFYFTPDYSAKEMSDRFPWIPFL